MVEDVLPHVCLAMPPRPLQGQDLTADPQPWGGQPDPGLFSSGASSTGGGSYFGIALLGCLELPTAAVAAAAIAQRAMLPPCVTHPPSHSLVRGVGMQWHGAWQLRSSQPTAAAAGSVEACSHTLHPQSLLRVNPSAAAQAASARTAWLAHAL